MENGFARFPAINGWAIFEDIFQTLTAASYVFENLTPGQIYLVDVNVVGSAGPSDYSDAAELMVV